jgi:hypothetical protein
VWQVSRPIASSRFSRLPRGCRRRTKSGDEMLRKPQDTSLNILSEDEGLIQTLLILRCLRMRREAFEHSSAPHQPERPRLRSQIIVLA